MNISWLYLTLLPQSHSSKVALGFNHCASSVLRSPCILHLPRLSFTSDLQMVPRLWLASDYFHPSHHTWSFSAQTSSGLRPYCPWTLQVPCPSATTPSSHWAGTLTSSLPCYQQHPTHQLPRGRGRSDLQF